MDIMNEKKYKSLCIVVNKKKGELIREFVKRIGVHDGKLKIQVENDRIFIPIKRNLSKDEELELRGLIEEFKIIFHKFSMIRHKIKNYREYLLNKIDKKYLKILPKSFDTIGGIIIIEIPEELKEFEGLIGDALIKSLKNIRTVFSKVSNVSGDYRLQRLELIGGEDNSLVVHKENNCIFELDVKKVYFSPRLSSERLRIVNQVNNGEKIIDMFAGVGPYSIQIAKNKAVEVISFDINPNAIKFLKRNIKLNKVVSIKPILGEAKNYMDKYRNYADRIIMNLPESAFKYIKIACELISKKGGIIHYYQFISNEQDDKEIIENISKEIEKSKRSIEKVLFIKRIKQISPNKSQIAIDIKIN
ncbi:MAG: class I SAM-dependent methyltransferase [Candidatus Helarchaeota archaeon]